MDLLVVVLMGVGLSADAFAVAVARSAACRGRDDPLALIGIGLKILLEHLGAA